MNASLRDKRYKDWTEVLPEIEFTLNATIQKITGKSQAEIIFGQRINHRWNEVKVIENERVEIIKKVRENEDKVKYRQENRTNRIFSVNDEVLVKVEGRTKDEERYMGPFMIIRKIHDRSYECQDINGKKIVRNVEWLKPFKKGGCKD
jgi:hypothetical protein